MSENDVLIGAVLDQSGSMGHLADATIEGFNGFLRDQRSVNGGEDGGIALLSLTLFSTSFDVRYVARDLAEVADLGTPENRYSPNGSTALYDAVATTIQGIEAWRAGHVDFDGRIIVMIMTDGQENASRSWNIERLNALIEAKTAEGWEFVFLGAGGSAWTEGNKFTSIPSASSFNYSGNVMDSSTVYAGISSSMTATRATAGSSFAAVADSNTALRSVARRKDDKEGTEEP